MPLVESYESHFESDVADMKNIGKPPRAGSIVGALILRRFTAGKPWAHLDIAGPGAGRRASGLPDQGRDRVFCSNPRRVPQRPLGDHVARRTSTPTPPTTDVTRCTRARREGTDERVKPTVGRCRRPGR